MPVNMNSSAFEQINWLAGLNPNKDSFDIDDAGNYVKKQRRSLGCRFLRRVVWFFTFGAVKCNPKLSAAAVKVNELTSNYFKKHPADLNLSQLDSALSNVLHVLKMNQGRGYRKVHSLWNKVHNEKGMEGDKRFEQHLKDWTKFDKAVRTEGRDALIKKLAEFEDSNVLLDLTQETIKEIVIPELIALPPYTLMKEGKVGTLKRFIEKICKVDLDEAATKALLPALRVFFKRSDAPKSDDLLFGLSDKLKLGLLHLSLDTFTAQDWKRLSNKRVVELITEYGFETFPKPAEAFKQIFTTDARGNKASRFQELIEGYKPILAKDIPSIAKYFTAEHWKQLSNRKVVMIINNKVFDKLSDPEEAFRHIFTTEKGPRGKSRFENLLRSYLSKAHITQIWKYFGEEHWQQLPDLKVLRLIEKSGFESFPNPEETFKHIFTTEKFGKEESRFQKLLGSHFYKKISSKNVQKMLTYFTKEHYRQLPLDRFRELISEKGFESFPNPKEIFEQFFTTEKSPQGISRFEELLNPFALGPIPSEEIPKMWKFFTDEHWRQLPNSTVLVLVGKIGKIPNKERVFELIFTTTENPSIGKSRFQVLYRRNLSMIFSFSSYFSPQHWGQISIDDGAALLENQWFESFKKPNPKEAFKYLFPTEKPNKFSGSRFEDLLLPTYTTLDDIVYASKYFSEEHWCQFPEKRIIEFCEKDYFNEFPNPKQAFNAIFPEWRRVLWNEEFLKNTNVNANKILDFYNEFKEKYK